MYNLIYKIEKINFSRKKFIKYKSDNTLTILDQALYDKPHWIAYYA